MEVLRNYEAMFVIDVDSGEQKIKDTLEFIRQTITKNKGEILFEKEIGKRKLAYEINKKKQGYYFLVYFKLDTQNVKEMERVFLINDEILRDLIVVNKKEVSEKDIKIEGLRQRKESVVAVKEEVVEEAKEEAKEEEVKEEVVKEEVVKEEVVKEEVVKEEVVKVEEAKEEEEEEEEEVEEEKKTDSNEDK